MSKIIWDKTGERLYETGMEWSDCRYRESFRGRGFPDLC